MAKLLASHYTLLADTVFRRGNRHNARDARERHLTTTLVNHEMLQRCVACDAHHITTKGMRVIFGERSNEDPRPPETVHMQETNDE